MKKVILASASPRRVALMKMTGIDFIQYSCEIDEEWSGNTSHEDAVMDIARRKAAQAVVDNPGYEMIVAADTVVMLENKVFGKPGNRDEAISMLTALNGKEHLVITGMCLMDSASQALYSAVEKTRVFFRRLEEYEIEAYADRGECYDKAGAYGIQGCGAFLIERIDGCYYNVVGLPLNLLRSLLLQAGIDIWRTNH